jgi:hypothetical protein
MLFALGLCSLPLAGARAQHDEREREAKAEFEAGVAAAQAEDYARAREHFLRSRQLVVKASTLLNLALADLKLGLVEEALFALDAIEAPAEGPQQERLRQRARKMRGEIEALREALAVKRTEQERTLASSPAAAPEPRPAAAVTSQAESLPANRVEAARLPAPVAPGGDAHGAEREPSASASARLRPSLIGPRVLFALGGALGASAIGSALWWRDRDADYHECLHAREVICDQRETIGRERTAAMAVTLALSGAALGLIASGAIWLVGKKRDVREQSLSVSLWNERGRLGVVANGRF